MILDISNEQQTLCNIFQGEFGNVLCQRMTISSGERYKKLITSHTLLATTLFAAWAQGHAPVGCPWPAVCYSWSCNTHPGIPCRRGGE